VDVGCHNINIRLRSMKVTSGLPATGPSLSLLGPSQGALTPHGRKKDRSNAGVGSNRNGPKGGNMSAAFRILPGWLEGDVFAGPLRPPPSFGALIYAVIGDSDVPSGGMKPPQNLHYPKVAGDLVFCHNGFASTRRRPGWPACGQRNQKGSLWITRRPGDNR
jgi:hypothetical protein